MLQLVDSLGGQLLSMAKSSTGLNGVYTLCRSGVFQVRSATYTFLTANPTSSPGIHLYSESLVISVKLHLAFRSCDHSSSRCGAESLASCLKQCFALPDRCLVVFLKEYKYYIIYSLVFMCSPVSFIPANKGGIQTEMTQ